MRVGALHLSNAEGLSRTTPAGEIAYGYNGKIATCNARLRETPPSVQGVQIGGDERWVDGTLRIYGDLRLVAQGFTSAYDVSASQYFVAEQWRVAGHSIHAPRRPPRAL